MTPLEKSIEACNLVEGRTITIVDDDSLVEPDRRMLTVPYYAAAVASMGLLGCAGFNPFYESGRDVRADPAELKAYAERAGAWHQPMTRRQKRRQRHVTPQSSASTPDGAKEEGR